MLDQQKFTEHNCLQGVIKLGFLVKGYLFVRANEKYVDDTTVAAFNSRTVWRDSKGGNIPFDKCLMKYETSANCERTFNEGNTDSIKMCLSNVDKYQTYPQLFYLPRKYSNSYLKYESVSEHRTILSNICEGNARVTSVSDILSSKKKFCDLI